MRSVSRTSAIVLGLSLVLGLSSLGYLLGSFAVTVKEYERTVTVKGLAEQEHEADIVIWPIQYTAADNDLGALYATIDSNNTSIRDFLENNGLPATAITLAPPAITDRLAQSYGDGARTDEFDVRPGPRRHRVFRCRVQICR